MPNIVRDVWFVPTCVILLENVGQNLKLCSSILAVRTKNKLGFENSHCELLACICVTTSFSSILCLRFHVAQIKHTMQLVNSHS